MSLETYEQKKNIFEHSTNQTKAKLFFITLNVISLNTFYSKNINALTHLFVIQMKF